MIITKAKALAIVSSLAIIKDIPELHPVYEASKKKSIEVQRKRGCTSCQANSALADVSNQALLAIISLSPTSIQKLKTSLGINEPIYAYSSTQSGVNLIQLGS